MLNLLVSGWGPYAYFNALDEVSRASTNSDQDTNAGNVQATGIQQARQGGDVAFSVGNDLSSAQDRMESGKR